MNRTVREAMGRVTRDLVRAHLVSFQPLDYRLRFPIVLAYTLAKNGWDVRTIEIDSISNKFVNRRETGIRRLLVPFGRENMGILGRVLRRILRYVYFLLGAILLRISSRPGDLVIAHDPWALFLVSLAVPLNRVVYYEVEIPIHLGPKTPLFERYLRGFLLRRARECALLISVERNRLKFLSRLFKNPRTMIILNVQSRTEVPAKVPIRAIGHKPRVLYAGRLWRYTLAPMFFEFVRKYHQRYNIEIFGSPDEDCIATYGEIRKLPGVTCHGFAPRSELEAALLRSDASIIMWDPFNFENFGLRYCAPNKFFESIAFGVPVACSPNPPMRDWLAQYRVGELIVPLSADGIHQTLKRLTTPGSYEIYQQSCRQAFDCEWNLEDQLAPVLQRLRNLPELRAPQPISADRSA